VDDDPAMVAGAELTLLFTDIEGSTRLLERLGERYRELLREHHRLMRETIAACGGREVEAAGDSFFAVFSRASDAVECARRAQLAFATGAWPDGHRPVVRMGVHTGTPSISDGDFIGIDVHRAARVMAVAYGGQVLVTEQTASSLEPRPCLLDLGHHRLKDLPAPEHLFQLVEPELERTFPPLRSLNRSNLPIPSTSIVGRREQVLDVLDRMARKDVRMVTLWGAAGSGKSRLAVELAGELVTRYRDGVWFVPLAQILDAGLVVTEIARVLDIDLGSADAQERTLAAALWDRELLLVLDNFEHVLPAGGTVEAVLSHTPSVDVLVTSRQPLRIRAEHRTEVAPLSVPDASEVFIQRATAVRPDLTLGDEDRAAVERICVRLDGLPLAVELAAARVASFGPRALEARLDASLKMPGSPRDLPERQQTLLATLDWSYRLLAPEERRLLLSLAPFIGGIRLEAADSIWGPEASGGLFSLAEQSLLRRREDLDLEPRFWMLETVRQFSCDRATAEGLAVEAAERHAAHFLAVTEGAASRLLSQDQRAQVLRLDADYPNLRAALGYLMEQDSARAIRMAANLEWFWVVRGYADEGRMRLDEALRVAPAKSPDRGRALAAAGQLALHTGRPVEAEPRLREALVLAVEAHDGRLTVLALTHLGWAAESLGDHVETATLHERAVDTARAAEDDWAIGLALNNYACTAARAGDLERARSMLEESLLLARRIGEPRAIALASGNLTELALAAGDLAQASTLINETLAQAQAVESLSTLAVAFVGLAQISLLRDDVEAAAEQVDRAIEPVRLAYDAEVTASLLSVAGTVAAIRQEPIRAAQLWAAAERARERIGLPDAPAADKLRSRWERAARAKTSNAEAWEAARAAGANLSRDEALALVSAVASR
jgi:predicted ATPase/class 3 adenylate cyclase